MCSVRSQRLTPQNLGGGFGAAATDSANESASPPTRSIIGKRISFIIDLLV
jgi:hypothetical protein